MPPDLTGDEMREAARALKGSILRQEVYADDGTAKAALPYSVSERSYKLTCLQPQGPNRHAVFFTHPSETIDYHYERNPADPRISHALTLAVDDYGNVLKSAAIGYQRRTPAFDEQRQDARDADREPIHQRRSSKTTPIARRFRPRSRPTS